MKQMKEDDHSTNAETKNRSVIFMWAAVMFSQFLMLIAVYYIKPDLLEFDISNISEGSNFIVLIGFAIAGLSSVAASFMVKKHLLASKAGDSPVKNAVTAYTAAIFMSEACSFLGLISAFMLLNPYFFLWIGLGILGTMLHFPRKIHFYDTTSSNNTFGRM